MIKDCLKVTHEDGELEVRAGHAVITHQGEWAQCSTPELNGAVYVAACLTFSMETLHQDAD